LHLGGGAAWRRRDGDAMPHAADGQVPVWQLQQVSTSV